MGRIISTNHDECVGCNKCIMVCPIKFANNVEIIDGQRRIEVDSSRCISCGKCLSVCDHNARTYLHDADAFWSDLKAGKNISVIVAPSFITNRQNRYQYLFSYLKSLGVNLIYDVSFGADLTAWLYLKYLKTNNPKLLIAQPCPPIVGYIQKYATSLIPYIAPIQSPAVNTAIYLKEYLDVTDKIAFISPCIAKKNEFEGGYANEIIDYNVPFEKICEYIRENNIDLLKYPKQNFDNPPAALGAKFSRPGGLMDNLHYHMPELKVKQIEGPEVVYDYLSYLETTKDLNFQVLDILNCAEGCNIGTSACKEFDLKGLNNTVKKELILDKRLKAQNSRPVDYSSYEKLLKYFDEKLDSDVFITKYKNLSNKIIYSEPTETEIEKIYQSLNKYTEESRNINCYSCGYKTCRDMAIAIHNDYNQPSSCYYFNKIELENKTKILEKNNKELSDVLEELSITTKNKEENELYIRTVLEHLSESVIVTNKKGGIEFVNKETAKIFKTSEEYCLGVKIQTLIQDLDFKNIINSEQGSYEAEYKVEISDGCKIDIKLDLSTFSFNGRELYIFIIQDITKEKELDEMKNQFVSMISHELRTPLTSIRGALGIISSGALCELPDKAQDLVNIASNNCVRLVNLINDILDLEKIKAGKMSFSFNEYKLIDLIEESVLYNNDYASQHQVRICVTNNADDAKINIDKDRFIQVMTNLISNACKFSKQEDTVDVVIDRAVGHVRISVIDYGVGIPKTDYDKIFKSFSQVDSSDTRKKGGTGLGLAICKSMVEKMNGQINFTSEENIGTTFYFEFPEMLQNIKKKALVLIYEQASKGSKSLAQKYKNLGLEVEMVNSRQDFKSIISEKNYDLISVDAFLPDINDILSEVKSYKTSKLPIILTTGNSNKPNKENFDVAQEISGWVSESSKEEEIAKILESILCGNEDNNPEILHIDDDEDILEVVSSSLKDLGFTKKASSVEEGLKALNENLYKVIILDYKIGSQSCNELIMKIKASKNKNAKIVAFSAYEISHVLSDKVDASLLKTKTSNEDFVSVIKSFL